MLILKDWTEEVVELLLSFAQADCHRLIRLQAN